MSYCPGCGAVNEGTSANCAACGRVLAVSCANCSTLNSLTAKFCSHCGRLLGSPTDIPPTLLSGEPIIDMVAGMPVIPSTEPPKEAIIKALAGGAVFLFLFLSQALQGFPLLSILIGLSSAAIALWGLIELSMWAMDRFDRPVDLPLSDLEEAFPVAPVKGMESHEGSFAELDSELAGKSETTGKAGPIVPELAHPKDKGTTDRPSGKLSGKKAKKSEAQPEDILEEPRREESREPSEEQKEAIERAQKAQSLVQFLDEGVANEISRVEKKLEKSPQNVSLTMRLAQLHEERGELTKALDIISQLASTSPAIPELYLFYGILLRRSEKIPEAKAAFERALSLNRFMSKAYYQLGVLERSQKNFPGAREAFQRCIQLAPDDAYSHYQLGMVYREAGELNLAQMELKRATMLNPADSYGHSQLGQVYQRTKQFDAAISEFSHALSLKPNDFFVLEKLGEVLFDKGDFPRAQEIFQEALAHQFHPEVKTMLSLAKVLHKLGKYKDLKPLVQEILRLSLNQPDALFYLALCQIDDKNHTEALTTLKQFTTAHPERWEGWMEMGKLYQGMDNHEEALVSFMKAAPCANDQAGVWNTIGILMSNRKDYEGALKAFRKAIAYDYTDSQIQNNYKAVLKKIESACRRTIEQTTEKLESDPQALAAYIDMGHAYELLDRPDEALMAYQRLLSIKPDHVEGLQAYAELLKTKGKLKMAIRCFKEILKLQPTHAEAAIQLITANLNLGYISEAYRYASTLKEKMADDPKLHFLLGKIYFAKGLAPRALKEFSYVAEKSKDPDMVGWAELMRRRLSRSV